MPDQRADPLDRGQPVVHDDDSAVLNEFLLVYLEDKELGKRRTLAEYQALFPGRDSLIAREHALLSEESRETAVASHASASALFVGAAGKHFGPYELVRQLGHGGQGVVWLARDTRLARPVALKLVTGFAASAFERFRREALAVSRLDDPGICTVYETGNMQGVSYIAMKYVVGEDLASLIASAKEAEGVERRQLVLPSERGREDERDGGIGRIVRAIERVARSLHEAHEVGVVHRDVKPGNVIIGKDGFPVLVDFGLASIQGDGLATLTRTGEVMGTPAYMPPEQLVESSRSDRRSDVYSLGVVLYECLTLHRPFEAESFEGLRHAILTEEAVDPRTHDPELPQDIRTILGVALERERERRYATAAALAEDLRRFRAGEPILAHAPSQVYRLTKLVHRHRALFATLLTILVILMAATGVTTCTMLNENRKTKQVLRLSALQELEDLIAEADRLWPPLPENVGPYGAWIERAEKLLDELPVHRSTLADLRAGSAQPAREDTAYLQARWWQGQLEKLVAGLESLSDAQHGLLSHGISPEHGWGVPKRLEFARSVSERSVVGAEAVQRWQLAIESIASATECPAYHGLRIVPQVGLVPLGRDPDSGLWEFAHLQTGTPPERGPDGKLILGEDSGIVLVLLPGGTFTMGAQGADPAGPNYCAVAVDEEAPPHLVTLSPFFSSKYEMTQGQWVRVAGKNPSRYGPHNYFAVWDRVAPGTDLLLHPVEQVSWTECTRVCAQLGLRLPSEAQWEYAARGGTTSVWWTGNEKETLAGAANLLDGYARSHGGEDWYDRSYDPWLDDGHTVHAPVGRYAANPFGLFDVLGNVWEWCLDSYDLDLSFYAESSGLDPVFDPSESHVLIHRGGSFHSSSQISRSAGRGAGAPEYVEPSVGVRPARALKGSP